MAIAVNVASNDRSWHIASFSCAAKFVGYWTNNGQRSVLGLNGSAAIDQSATSDTVYCSLMEIFTGFLSVARLQNPPAIGRG
jgi:hypothetical protein